MIGLGQWTTAVCSLMLSQIVHVHVVAVVCLRHSITIDASETTRQNTDRLSTL